MSASDPSIRNIAALTFVCLALLNSPAAIAQTNGTAATAWKFTSSAAIKESFDSNIYLQSETARADQESFVTSLLPQFTGSWLPTAAFNTSLNYSPELTWFHGAASEDHILHRATLKLSGAANKTTYDWTTAFVVIDGESSSPIWTGIGGAPAAGGPAIRDRRDAAVYRSNFRVTHEIGKWLLRPAATLYVHDFQTDQRATAGYQNSVDRMEVTAGLDLGHRISKLTAWFGYRYGQQDQARLLQFTEEYDNTFHRVLFGLEGTPVGWLKLSLNTGPEFRRYDHEVPATFLDRDRVNWFIDSSMTVTPTKTDTITGSVKQFQQPGFGGRSAYDDLTYDLSWRHKFNDTWTVGISGRAYNTDFLLPVVRNDWVYSGSLFLNWNITKKLNTEVSYTCESGLSQIVNMSGREYTRHLLALGLKYNF